MSIKIEYRNLETWKTRNHFFVQVWNFLLPLSLKVLWHKEREVQSFYFGFFICPPSCVAPTTKVSASKWKPTVFFQGRTQLYSTFFKFPKSSARFRCVMSFTLASPRFPSRAIVTSLSDTSALHTHVNTCVNVASK